jgi:hypothetical protein
MRWKMPKYTGYVKHIYYYKVEVDAECLGTAKDKMWEFDIHWAKPEYTDCEIVDIEELSHA